jgi:hypothetical protein
MLDLGAGNGFGYEILLAKNIPQNTNCGEACQKDVISKIADGFELFRINKPDND